MKKGIFYSIITLLLITIISLDAQAQRDKRDRRQSVDEYFDESGGFKHRLWYGGGFNLGFSGNSQISLFQLGISPMVGYKIFEPLSIGPRVGIEYNHIKGIANDGNYHSVQPISFSYGVFSRFKIFGNFFAHAEFEHQDLEQPDYLPGLFLKLDQDNNVITLKGNRDNFYVGAGYNSGGVFAYEIMLLYNTILPENDPNSPWVIRVGFTYKY